MKANAQMPPGSLGTSPWRNSNSQFSACTSHGSHTRSIPSPTLGGAFRRNGIPVPVFIVSGEADRITASVGRVNGGCVRKMKLACPESQNRVLFK